MRVPACDLRTVRLAALGGLCALLGSCGPYRVSAAQVETVAIPVDLGRDAPSCLSVQVHRGHVLVTRSEALRVQLEASVQASDAEVARARAAQLLADVQNVGACRRVTVSRPEGAPLDSVDLRVQIELPDAVRLEVVGSDANVAVRGCRGDIDVRSHGGTINARPDGGTCRLETTSGAIRLEGSFARAEVRTDSGRIDVTLPSDRSAVELSGISQSGPLQIDMADGWTLQLHLVTNDGQVRSELPARWLSEGAVRPDGTRLFEGALGADGGRTANAEITTRSAILQVRRLVEPAR